MDERRTKFEHLPEERQRSIVNAGVEMFGRYDYKNASTDAIARKAGISKSLLFFYFKNKKTLYLYLTEHLMDKMADIVVDEQFHEIDDFFELLIYAARKKGTALVKFPYAMEFSIRAFYPDHKDIKDTMDGWTQNQIDLTFETYFKHVRFDRFREDIDPRHIMDMMIWMADGYLHQQRSLQRPIDIDAMMEEFHEWCILLKAYAYKEEYR